MEYESNEIAFSELDQWIKKELDVAFEEIMPEAIQFMDKFQIIINSIKTLGEQLDEEQIKEDEVAQQFIPVINDAKNTIVTAIKRETSTDLQEIITFEDVLTLKERAKGLLNRLGETGGSHRRTIHSFFGKHAKVLKVELGLLDKGMKQFNVLIDDYTEKSTLFKDSKVSMVRISESIRIENESLKKRGEISDELEWLRSQNTELTKKVQDNENTGEFKIFMKSQDELINVKNAVNNILSEVNSSFSRISRPLGKYTYEVGLDKESKSLMQSIMENPVNLMYDSKINQVIEVLNKVKDGMKKGKISTKNPDKDIENLNGLLDNLQHYVKQFEVYDNKVNELQDKTLGVKTKLELMDNESKRIRYEIQQKESNMIYCDEEIDNARSTINDELKKISERIERAVGSRIRVVI